MLGLLGDAPYYFIKGEITLSEEFLATLTGVFAYYFYIVYVTYSEEVATEAERGAERISMLGVFTDTLVVVCASDKQGASWTGGGVEAQQ